jgi:hypothetical protein
MSLFSVMIQWHAEYQELSDTKINFIEPQNIEQGILNVEVKKQSFPSLFS